MNLQSFSGPIEKSLTERLVLRDGLEDAPVVRDVTDRPLTQARTAQPEDVTEMKNLQYELFKALC